MAMDREARKKIVEQAKTRKQLQHQEKKNIILSVQTQLYLLNTRWFKYDWD
jgi:sulfatase maturation enzyme AslB (radical SAM superfamily)